MNRKSIKINEHNLFGILEENVKKILKEGYGIVLNEGKNNQNYSHFAVNKSTNRIVNGWDYSDIDPADLRNDRKYYFIEDLVNYELNPANYRILTGNVLRRMNIDPDNDENWAQG